MERCVNKQYSGVTSGLVRPTAIAVSAVATYSAVLLVLYRDVVSPQFGYAGYHYSTPTGPAVAATIAFSVAPSILLSMRIDRPSALLCWLLYLVTYIPAQIVPSLALQRDLFELQVALFSGFVIVIGLCRLPVRPLPGVPTTRLTFAVAHACLLVALLGLEIGAAGIHLRWVSPLDVYDIRSEHAQSLDQSGLARYALPWLSTILFPVLMIAGFGPRRWPLLLVGLAGELFLYSQSGHKRLLLALPILLITAFMTRKSARNAGLLLASSLSLVCLTAWAIDVATETVYASSIFVRRMLIAPGLLTGYYFEFFSTNPFALYAHSFTKWFLSYPYDLPPPRLIGYAYFGSATMAANANVWADAFANAGHAGVILHSALLGIFLHFFDRLSHRLGLRTATLILVFPGTSILNTGLSTCLLTHGLGWTVIVALFAPDTFFPSAIAQEAPLLPKRQGCDTT